MEIDELIKTRKCNLSEEEYLEKINMISDNANEKIEELRKEFERLREGIEQLGVPQLTKEKYQRYLEAVEKMKENE